MDYVIYAVPFFLLAVVLEAAWGYWRGRNTYRLNDTMNSLSLGLLRNLSNLVGLGLGAAVFSRIESSWALLPAWDVTSPWSWVIGMVAYDFCYYWFHRIGHERQIFWASHVAHHQSEEYNLSTALRQTGTGFLLSWVFYVPLFFLGMPAYLYASVASLNLIYQFWVHTRHIPKLGWYEWIFITPSNHRVHHAQNPEYVDRNYGGLFILWDRLFGTYTEERDDIPIVYGISVPLRSWNPLWANLHIYADMLCDSIHTRRWRDKLHVWVARTGWRPADVAQRYPQAKANLADFHKYDPPLPMPAAWALFGYFVILAGSQIWFEAHAGDFAGSGRWLAVALLVYSLVVLGAALDGRRWALALEIVRWPLTAAALWLAQAKELLSTDLATIGWVALAAGAVLMLFALRSRHEGIADAPKAV